MTQHEHQEILDSLQLLTDTAERFVQHVPRSERLDQVQRAMLAAITRAQLVLSIHRLPPPEAGSSGPPAKKQEPKSGQGRPLPFMRLV